MTDQRGVEVRYIKAVGKLLNVTNWNNWLSEMSEIIEIEIIIAKSLLLPSENIFVLLKEVFLGITLVMDDFIYFIFFFQ